MNPEEWSFPEDAEAPPREWLAWDAFVGAKTADAKCHAWLSLVCGNVHGARAAAVLIESFDAQTFVPIAVWPKASPDMGRLAGVVEDAIRDRRGVVRPAADSAELMHVAYPLMLDQRVDGIVALEVACDDAQIGEVLREIHWGSAWLANLLGARELDEAIRAKERVGSVLETVAVSLRHGKLQQALFDLTHVLRRHFACARVAIGLVDLVRVRLSALSDAATFEKNTPLAKAYVAAMEEALDAACPLQSTAGGEQSADTDAPTGVPVALPRQEGLKAVSGAGVTLSYPLLIGSRCVAVLTLERESKSFDEHDLAWLAAFGAFVAPVIEQRREAERGLISRLVKDARNVLQKIFGPRHLTWKAATALVLLSVLVLVLLPFEYRVSAKTVIEGEVQRVAAAPFEGFVAAAHARAGDTVKAGELLAQLDDRELRIEEVRWSSERDQYQNRYREAMAINDLTAMQVVGAQLRQAEAQLALVTEKIERARIVSPFDGIVVSGDLSQQIGAPVETGKKLFEVAPLQSYRVILQVDERDIRHVQLDQTGRLVMTGIAGEPMPFRVSKVTPVAMSQEGRNFFRVEASLSEASPRLRPGMEGVGKIEVGSRSLWWIATHGFSDWLILQLWTWMP